MMRHILLSSVLLSVLTAACSASQPPRYDTPPPAPALPSGHSSQDPQPLEPSTDTARKNPVPMPGVPSAPIGELEGPVLEVHFIDVGQGDSALIRTPGGRIVLVDSGPSRGSRKLVDYLEALAVRRIDLTINTHNHADHIGGLVAVMDKIPVTRALVSGVVHPTPTYEKMLTRFEKSGVDVKIARAGRRVKLDEGVELDVIGPEEPLVHGSRSDPNANSVVFRLTYGEIDFLFTGDAEHETEERLLHRWRRRLSSEVLKVAHHGSRYATSEAFLNAVAPEFAVISSARKNRYGHPAPETIGRLEAHQIKIFQTARDGNVIAATDGTRMRWTLAPKSGDPHSRARVWSTGDAPAQLPAAPARGGIDLNEATVDELVALPGVGKKMAERIIADREANGPFRTVNDLARVKGVGKSKLGKLRPYATVSPPPG